MLYRFETLRLSVFEVSSGISPSALSTLLLRSLEILAPAVVEHLPPHFQNINSLADVKIWFERMVSESRLFVIKHREDELLAGFLFAHSTNNGEARIGYLLAESYWGQGLASELLKGFVEFAEKERQWLKLTAGVDKTNGASSHLLARSGFIQQPSTDGAVVFYEYRLSTPQA